MKKKLLLVALGLLVAVQAVAAPFNAPHKNTVSIKWRDHVAAPSAATILGTPNSGYDAMGWFVDSLTSTHHSAAVQDTSAPIPTISWSQSPSAGVNDSSLVAYVTFYDADANAASGADSLYFYVQGSPDGKTWQTLATVGQEKPSATEWVLPGAAGPNSVAMTCAISTVHIWQFKFVRSSSTAALRQVTGVYDLQAFPLIRFIAAGDRSAGTLYAMAGQLTFWSPDANLTRSQ